MQKFLSVGVASLIALSTLTPFVQASEGTPSLMSSGSAGSGKTVDFTCIRTAVSTRESAVRLAYSNLSAAYLAGLDVRAKALDAVWSTADRTERKTAREAAWSAWDATAKSARQAFRTARKAAWDTFRTSAKVCRTPSSELESVMAQNLDVQ